MIPTDASRTRAVPAGNDSADELLRYDRHTGMFDVSLAAAWQLGRLLALADPELSVQIANWKASGHRAQNQASDRKLLADRVGIEADQPAADLQAQIAEALVKPVVERLVRPMRRLRADYAAPIAPRAPGPPLAEWLQGAAPPARRAARPPGPGHADAAAGVAALLHPRPRAGSTRCATGR